MSIFGINPAISQTFESFNNINFKEISTTQLDLILRNAQSQGLNQFDLLQIAKSQGLSDSEIEILNKKKPYYRAFFIMLIKISFDSLRI